MTSTTNKKSKTSSVNILLYIVAIAVSNAIVKELNLHTSLYLIIPSLITLFMGYDIINKFAVHPEDL